MTWGPINIVTIDAQYAHPRARSLTFSAFSTFQHVSSRHLMILTGDGNRKKYGFYTYTHENRALPYRSDEGGSKKSQ